ncbi:hypothetical protein [Arenimonas oryziterrae]|uniref:hypothetical protein n=1 Tax=Arenimonas oryziterrae TaxID=498055 RepID=UPI0012DC83D9|nr:hypothetical protein [Arenimonas oryziterrae]
MSSRVLFDFAVLFFGVLGIAGILLAPLRAWLTLRGMIFDPNRSGSVGVLVKLCMVLIAVLSTAMFGHVLARVVSCVSGQYCGVTRDSVLLTSAAGGVFWIFQEAIVAVFGRSTKSRGKQDRK